MTDTTPEAVERLIDRIHESKAGRDVRTDAIATLRAQQAEIARLTVERDAALAQVSAWQPIETAPRTSMILAHSDGMVRLVIWESGRWVQVGATIEQGWFVPTHWMPLPAPPVDSNTTPSTPVDNKISADPVGKEG